MKTNTISIPFSRPDLDEDDIARVVEVLRSGWITTGPVVREFETALKDFLSVERVVCLNSATAGMELVLRALGIGPGDEVITTVYTYAATASVIRHTGADPILVDTAPESFLIDPEAVRRAIGPRTKAIIPVDFAGIPCDYQALRRVVEEARPLYKAENEFQEALGGVAILADAAHSLGARYHGERVPLELDFAVYSFHAVKNLTTAEGGAVVWRGLDDSFERRLRLLALHGQSKDALAKLAAGSWEYDIELSGFKHNLTDLQAALALGQLRRYPAQLEKRREMARFYREELGGESWIHPFNPSPDHEPSYHIYPLRVKGYREEERNRLIAALAVEGIATNVHFKPLPLFTAFKNQYRIEDYPRARAVYQNEITLPLYPGLSLDDRSRIVRTLQQKKELLD